MVYSRPFLFYGPSAMPRLGLMDQRGVQSAVLGPTRSQTQIRNYHMHVGSHRPTAHQKFLDKNLHTTQYSFGCTKYHDIDVCCTSLHNRQITDKYHGISGLTADRNCEHPGIRLLWSTDAHV